MKAGCEVGKGDGQAGPTRVSEIPPGASLLHMEELVKFPVELLTNPERPKRLGES